MTKDSTLSLGPQRFLIVYAVKIDNEPPFYGGDEAMELLNKEHLTQRKHPKHQTHPKNPRK